MKSLVLGGLSALLLAGSGWLCTEANAQVFSSQRSGAPQGTNQSANQRVAQDAVQGTSALRTTLARDETLYLNKDNTYSYDLVLRSMADVGGQRLPVGAIVRGQFEPAEGGLVYVANSVEVADRIIRLNATSGLLRDRKDPRQTSTGAVLTDAAIGAAGGYVLGEVLGNADVWEIVGGAAAGVVVGNTTAPLTVVIRPEDEIMLYSN
ncbi:MAG: hypothetical protein HLUCCA11_17600 [Phormidesmis priestleyi Ana]|uniref:Uncharacterized protein n=1 Tax=Phormidesmis priestleyi Ana TaxID=1666911 RepID=A0A0P7ZTU8_9CYAN|nr:MAG: hypothetical protein HLUCCA11_17600 [Phormidesmis priestleyi Ana]